ncbi:MAG: hypothetical protein AB8I08_05700 [Sandaracinaceae bacterium]
MTELDGRLHILTPRTPPSAPWFTVHATMVRGGMEAMPALAERLRRGRPGGGYRGAVRQHRARMSRDELVAQVRSRAPIDGGLTVLGALNDSAFETKLVFLRYLLIIGPLAASYVGVGLGGNAGAFQNPRMAMLGAAGFVLLSWMAAALAGPVGRWAFRRLSTPGRVLVLAPDGCVVGLPTGVRAFRWDEVADFRIETRGGVEGLSVFGSNGAHLGALGAQYVNGPLRLLAAVANTYREAAA